MGLFLLAGAALAPSSGPVPCAFAWGPQAGNLRLQFSARWKEVYIASWPVFALALVWFGVFFGLQMLSPELSDVLGLPKKNRKPRMPAFTPTMGGLLVLGLVLTVLCASSASNTTTKACWCCAQLGAEHGRWKPVYMDFVKIWLATVAVFIVRGARLRDRQRAGGRLHGPGGGPPASRWGCGCSSSSMAAMVVGVFVLFRIRPGPRHREARVFQLMWNNIGAGQIARFNAICAARAMWLRLQEHAVHPVHAWACTGPLRG